jgi:hypothetical protein
MEESKATMGGRIIKKWGINFTIGGWQIVTNAWVSFKGRFASMEQMKDTIGAPMEKEITYITIVTKLEARWGEVLRLHDNRCLVKKWMGVFDGNNHVPL